MRLLIHVHIMTGVHSLHWQLTSYSIVQFVLPVSQSTAPRPLPGLLSPDWSLTCTSLTLTMSHVHHSMIHEYIAIWCPTNRYRPAWASWPVSGCEAVTSPDLVLDTAAAWAKDPRGPTGHSREPAAPGAGSPRCQGLPYVVHNICMIINS